jgi:hypothetical protein
MHPTELVFEIKSRFEKAIEAKTGWGKNELKKMYDQIVIEVLAEQLNKETLKL